MNRIVGKIFGELALDLRHRASEKRPKPHMETTILRSHFWGDYVVFWGCIYPWLLQSSRLVVVLIQDSWI